MVGSVVESSETDEFRRPHFLARLGNFVLLLLLVGNLLGLIRFAMDREAVSQLSDGMFGPAHAIMGSWFLDAFLHSGTAVALGLILISTIAKEFLLKRLRTRVLINLGLFVALMMLNVTLISVYSAPIVGVETVPR